MRDWEERAVDAIDSINLYMPAVVVIATLVMACIAWDKR
jgi:hypothetical protein